MRSPFFAALTLIFVACAGGTMNQSLPSAGSPAAPDLLRIDGGTIYTGHDVLHDRSVIVRGDRIEAVVSPEEAAAKWPAARVIDARDMTVLPGLTDAHVHVMGLGEALANVDLVGTESFDQVVQRVSERAPSTPKTEWILGRGWDQNDWAEKRFPTASQLDAATTTHPVWLRRVDGHAGVANTAALLAAGITAETKDPEGGKIIRDANGHPTGVFVDNAMALVDRIIPPPSRATRKSRLENALHDIARNGLVEVHDAGVDQETIDLYRELIDEGRMPIRVYAMVSDQELPGGEWLEDRWFAKGPLIDYGGRLTVRSVKMYADGALGSRGAALLAPYDDDPDNTGLLTTTPEHILDVARRARAAGFQVNTHAIGDRGNRRTIEAYEEAGVTPADRFRIEHLQVIALEDLPRVAARGIIASMQPTHATSDMEWAETRIGKERIKGAYAWRKVLDHGIPLAFGSDFPVEAVNPFFGIHAAVTRQDQKGWPAGGWHPEERLTLREAIDAFTQGAAFASFQEKSRGTIEPGKLADFTIVDGDLFQRDPSTLFSTKVEETIVGGRAVYQARAATMSSK
ncbi:MAG: amidohydrolase [Thermoanaerobaculia bacterium]